MVDGHFSKDAELRKEKRDLGKLRQLTASAQSRPIIERLRQALSRIKLSRYHLSKSAFGRALDYALTLWPILEVYIEDSCVEIDNNSVENVIRPSAVGKKNWQFIGDADAG